ncbi:MAG: hypothetical protein KGJ58_01640 [Patescibacteria group bacterium]|nr:hypothetical protein [Patescibacteria group bacterium]MDE1988498.1 hypothetical protein [Patescibacteria group bacterium]MDE2218141.1 hypothetical protein [Patescibacteria group bacterium]
MSIKDLLLKIKGECRNSAFMFNHKAETVFRADFFVAIVIILAAFASFGLGRLSALEGKRTPVLVEINSSSWSLPNKKAPIKDLISAKIIQNYPEKSFVGSKTGTKYYLPWCGAVLKIKEENKIRFASEAEAQKAGYAPATNCRGLK